MDDKSKKIFTTEFKVGLTIIVSTLILILGIIWGKEFSLHTNKYQLQVVFDKVGGMVPGDPVTVNGVKEGKVVGIDWKNRQVLCTLEINDRIQLYEDATFTVVSAELLAGMKVEIEPGRSSKRINLSLQPFKGVYGGRIVDVGMVIGDLATDMSRLSFRLDSTIDMVNNLLKTGTLQNDLQQSLSNINQITTDFKPLPLRFKRSFNSLDSTLDHLNRILKNSGKDVDNTMGKLSSISTRLDTVTTSLQAVMGKLENQDGTLGKMVYDSSMYNYMNRTLLSIDSLAKEIKTEGLKLDLF